MIMDYEKAYKETLEKARTIIKNRNASSVWKDWLCNTFPELQESEDEKIRKELLEHCKNQAKPYVQTGNKCPQIQSWITWLEKQNKFIEINPSEFDLQLNRLLKQFKSLPKEELESSLSFYLNVIQNDGTYKEEEQGKQKPFFNVGDTIIKKHNSDINKFGQFTITDITGGKYWYNDRIICDINEQNDWELVEQKPADVEEPDFFNDFKAKDWYVSKVDGKIHNMTYNPIDSDKPKSKHVIDEGKDEMDSCFTKMMNGEKVSPAWSEEDERMFHVIIADFKGFKHENTSTLEPHFDECIKWLKSLKQRIK